MKNVIVISLGGSLIVPKEGIDFIFLKKFKKIIESFAKSGYKFIIVCGGGRTARDYQNGLRKTIEVTQKQMDLIGIEATKLNASLVRNIFDRTSYPEVILDPTKKINFRESILICAGWKPGCSTDFDAVLFAKMYRAKKIINLTNVDYLYDKNPTIYKNAKKIKNITWADFRKIVGNKWSPGANLPFDPIATREAQKLKLELVLANGKKLNNLKKIINGDKFIGSIVR